MKEQTVSSVRLSLVFCGMFFLVGCASGVYMEPTTGETSVLNFNFPKGQKRLIIYEKAEKCEGWTSVPLEISETDKVVKVKKGEKVSFTVDYILDQSYGWQNITTRYCQNTYTLEVTEEEYNFKYGYDGGVCGLRFSSVDTKGEQSINIIEREYTHPFMDSLSAPHCK